MNDFLISWPKQKLSLKLFVLGALSALSMPPIDAWWILFLTTPLALLIFAAGKKERLRKTLWRGWVFGLGYFTAALHWVAYAFFVNPENDLWMMPIAVGALAAGMALFWAVGTTCAFMLTRRGHPVFISWPLCMAAVEWLRGHILTGFPWAVSGQAADGMRGVEQLASVIGMEGLTLVIWLWAAAPFALLTGKKTHSLLAVLVLATLPATLIWGEWHLSQNPTAYVDDVLLRLVQPNINQSDKWREGNARAIFDHLKSMSAAQSDFGKVPTHIIWPESAVPFLLNESEEGKAELAAALKPGQILLTGAVRRAAPRDDADYFTSILVLDHTAKILGIYDKWHLVPGGEFLPLASLLEPLGLRKVVTLPGSFRPGPGPTTLDIPGAGSAGMSICYEAIFPGAISNSGKRANWLVNVTNDGWFGNSAGPYQHLAQMRLRAIELGLPAARAANTGISAIIDPLGRTLNQSQLGATGNYDVPLPQSVSATLYSRYGSFFLFLLLLITIALGELLKDE